jgi:hypothetical protein
MPAIHTLVLVEGESDAAAVAALARRFGMDIGSRGIQISSAGGIGKFPHVLEEFVHIHPAAHFCGMYDAADERYVRRALAAAATTVAPDDSLESVGFFACVADLEDELIRALGAEAVERVLDTQGELASFRRFQAMPEHRRSPVHRQLHRFLGTRATRKIRCAKLLVDELDLSRLPRPFAGLVGRMRRDCSTEELR